MSGETLLVKRPKRGRPRKVRGRGRPTLAATERKRVEILKDAVKQLKLEAYVAHNNGYVQLQAKYDLEAAVNAAEILTGKKAKEISAKTLLPNLISASKPCDVCAKGALTISAIRKYNACSLEELEDIDETASQRARRIFGTANADRMERFYEGWTNSDQTAAENEKIRDWEDKYPDNVQRLIAIFQNAIKNKGVFKP